MLVRLSVTCFSTHRPLLLPKTNFPIRENLKEQLDFTSHAKLYRQQQSALKPSFVLHDGPPFANGKLHIGENV